MKVWKSKALLVLLLISFTGCQKEEIDCEEFCANPERHQLFENFETEKQFEHFRACPCWGDSISEKYIFAGELANNPQIVEFLLDKLRNENDVEALEESLNLLRYVAGQKNLKGRKDINDLVYATVNRIPDRDERDLLNKIFGREQQTRRERLTELAKEIEDKTR